MLQGLRGEANPVQGSEEGAKPCSGSLIGETAVLEGVWGDHAKWTPSPPHSAALRKLGLR